MAGQIDLTALQHASGEIPWEAIRAAVEAVVAEPGLAEEVVKRYGEITKEPYVVATFEYYYLPFILTKAAGRLGEPHARRVHAFLVDELVMAGELDDDGMLEFLMYCGTEIGPAILPEVKRVMEDSLFDPTSGGWFHVWGLAEVTQKSTDEGMRTAIAERAISVLTQVKEGKMSMGDGVVGGNVAQLLGEQRAIPLLEAIEKMKVQHVEDRGTQREYSWNLKFLRGEEPAYEAQSRDLEEEVTRGKQLLEEWYAERGKNWNGWADIVDEAMEGEEEYEDEEDGEWGPEALLPLEPIRHQGKKVGRNDPCPCGSGKKYKKCCGG